MFTLAFQVFFAGRVRIVAQQRSSEEIRVILLWFGGAVLRVE